MRFYRIRDSLILLAYVASCLHRASSCSYHGLIDPAVTIDQ